MQRAETDGVESNNCAASNTVFNYANSNSLISFPLKYQGHYD